MNSKQIAAILVVVLTLVAVQIGLSLDRSAKAKAAEVVTKTGETEKLRQELDLHRNELDQVRRQSDSLIQFVSEWETYFALMEEPQKAETSISMEVRDNGLMNLSQSYDHVKHEINNKGVASLPELVRASLVFEDNYAKLLNWMGKMEKIEPTMRVGRMQLSKGSRGDDLRMELVLEVPMRKKKK